MDFISEISSTLSLISEIKDIVSHTQSNQRQSQRLVRAISRFEDPLNFLLANPNRISGQEDNIIELNCLVEESITHLTQFTDSNWELRGNKFKQDGKKFTDLNENLSRIFVALKENLEINSTESFESIENFAYDYQEDRSDLSNKLRNFQLSEQEFTRIQQSDIELSIFLGDGASARVYKGMWCGTEVAVKTVVKKVNYERLVMEARQQEYLKFPNIVATYGVCETIDEIWFIGELAPLKDLKHLIHDQPDIELPVYLKIAMLLDIANGMKYLHSRKPEMLHRDLKSGNVLVFPGLKIKIADFGTARTLTVDSVTQSSSKVGSELWMAPEIILGQANLGSEHSDGSGDEKEHTDKFFLYSKQSDVWSFAIVMYELICRKLPFNGSTVQAVTNLSLNKRPKIESSIQSNNDYESLISLMSKCWKQDRQDRPLFPEIVLKLHENLKKYNRSVLLQTSSHIEEILRNRIAESISKLASTAQIDQNLEELKLSDEEIKKIDEMNSIFEAKIARFNLINETSSGHTAVVYSLTTPPNGEYIISGSDDCTIKMWRNNYKKSNNDCNISSFSFDKTLMGHSDFVRTVKCGFLNNQNKTNLFIVSGSYDKTIKMWDAETGECRWTGKHPHIVLGVAVSTECNNDENILVASVGHDKSIKIWGLEQKSQDVSPIRTIKNAYNTDGIYDISFCSINTNRSEKMIVIGSEISMSKSYGVVKIFDIETGNRSGTMRTRHQNIEYPSHVFISPCNRYAISSTFSDDRIIIHDLRTSELAHEISSNGRLFDVKPIGNNYLLLASNDGTVKIVNYKTNQCIQTFTNPTNPFSSVISDPYCNYIACAEENTYQLKVFGDQS